MVRVIIAGGRDFVSRIEHGIWLEKKLIELEATEVVSGACTGADMFGEDVAKRCFIPITRFPAEWALFGKSAGPIRNEEMAEYSNACILFPGGRGTLDMKSRAIKHGLKVVEYSKHD